MRLLIVVLTIALMGCAHLSTQDRQFITEQAVIQVVDTERKAARVYKAIYVIERSMAPEFPALAVDQLLVMFDDWVNEQDWTAQEKHAAKYVIRRSMPEFDWSLPIADDERRQILEAMRSVRDVLEAAGYRDIGDDVAA